MFCSYKDACQRNHPQTCYISISSALPLWSQIWSYAAVIVCMRGQGFEVNAAQMIAWLSWILKALTLLSWTGLSPPSLSVPWNQWSCRPPAKTCPSAQFSAHCALSPVPLSLEAPPATSHNLFAGNGAGNLLSVPIQALHDGSWNWKLYKNKRHSVKLKN